MTAVGKRLLHGAPLILSFVMVVAIAYVLARLTWLLVSPIPSPSTTLQPVSVETNRGRAPNAAAKATKVAAMHLFGQASGESSSSEALDAPETNLNITLHGIIAADDSERSRALIVSGGNTKIYAVGASLGSGTTIRTIDPDAVVLARKGHLEMLKLPRNQGDESRITIAGEVTKSGNGAPPGLELSDKPARASAGYVVPGAHGLIRAKPAMVDGEMKGYRVFPGKKPRQFVQAGLRPGDIVEAIDGESLSNPRNLAELVNRLQHGKSVTLKVVRHGQARKLTISLDR